MRRLFVLVQIVALVLIGSIGYYAGTHHLLAPASANAASSTATCVTFPETGKQVCDRFLEYWQQNGGLAQQGLPLTDVFNEVNPTNGKTYQTQYFERARFELHPENAPPYDVLLGLVGREQLCAKYPNCNPTSSPQPSAQPTTQPSPQPSAPPSNGIGQVFTFTGAFGEGSFRGTVTDIKDNVSLTDNGKKLQPNGKYVAVFIQCANIGNSPAEVGSFSFYLVDGRNRQFSLDDLDAQFAAEDQYGKKILYTTVQPGLSVEHVFVFDVPTDAGNFRMVAGD